MKKLKKNKGISLIVLVITIIVMIISAAAIILSISNSGIMEEANKAKLDSDAANIKEYVNVLEAEWKLEAEGTEKYSSKEAYINKKLEDKGYTGALLMEDGTLYTNLQANAKAALQEGIQIGEVVNYTITDADIKEYTPDSEKTGTINSELTTQTNLKWIYIGISEKGELLITPDVSEGVPANSNVTLSGAMGWSTGPGELDVVCDKLYSLEGRGTARSMNIDDVIRILDYTGEKGAYNHPTTHEYTPTTEAIKIKNLEKNFGNLERRETPEVNKDIEDYYSDYYYILNKEDPDRIKNSEYLVFVYPTSGEYWLASSCAYATYELMRGLFYVRFVRSSSVFASAMWVSSGNVKSADHALRPVVCLSTDIHKAVDDDGSVIWNFGGDAF